MISRKKMKNRMSSGIAARASSLFIALAACVRENHILKTNKRLLRGALVNGRQRSGALVVSLAAPTTSTRALKNEEEQVSRCL